MTVQIPEGNPAAIRAAAETIRAFPRRFNSVAARVASHVSTLVQDCKGPYFGRLAVEMKRQDDQISAFNVSLFRLAADLDRQADDLQQRIDAARRAQAEEARAKREEALRKQRGS